MTLEAWLTSFGVPDNEFAKRIGVSRVTLFRFKTGRRVPDRGMMESIHHATDGAVTPNDFFNIAARAPASESAA